MSDEAFAGRIATIRESAAFIREHQWAIECNSQMEDVLATTARALLECANLLESLRKSGERAR